MLSYGSPHHFSFIGMDQFRLLQIQVVDFLEATSLTNPLNVFLVAVMTYLLYTLYPSTPLFPTPSNLPTKPIAYNWRPSAHPESIVWRTWRPEELSGYDGTSEGKEGGRILFAIRRKVYDVTTGGSFYGPGPYQSLNSVE